MFQGNNVWNQNWEWAVFDELGSNPATMQATKVCDCYGLLPGHSAQQADARQAYTQTVLGGVKTWVELPRDQWPEEWVQRKLVRPVCRLWRALYGHPDSGGCWEPHCNASLADVGFRELIYEDWRSCFWHPELRLLLTVYVDDFKLSRPAEKLQQGLSLFCPKPQL